MSNLGRAVLLSMLAWALAPNLALFRESMSNEHAGEEGVEDAFHLIWLPHEKERAPVSLSVRLSYRKAADPDVWIIRAPGLDSPTRVVVEPPVDMDFKVSNDGRHLSIGFPQGLRPDTSYRFSIPSFEIQNLDDPAQTRVLSGESLELRPPRFGSSRSMNPRSSEPLASCGSTLNSPALFAKRI